MGRCCGMAIILAQPFATGDLVSEICNLRSVYNRNGAYTHSLDKGYRVPNM